MTTRTGGVVSPIRVLAVDDSVVARRAIARGLEGQAGVELVGTAGNGRVALDRLDVLRPDVITLDLDMPVMDGLETLAEIRRRDPAFPVVIFSRLPAATTPGVVDAMCRGVTEFVQKPTAGDRVGVADDYIRDELVPIIRQIARPVVAAAAPEARPPAAAAKVRRAPGRAPVSAVVVAASTGGPDALRAIVGGLPDPLTVPVLIVQHVPVGFAEALAERLGALTAAEVTVGQHGQVVPAGGVVVAPGGLHMGVVRDGSRAFVELSDAPKENFCRPAADVLFRSAAHAYGAGVLAVVLTGMGHDGLEGSRAVVAAGGSVFAQSPETAVVGSMPAAVAGFAEVVAPLDGLVEALRGRIVRGKRG